MRNFVLGATLAASLAAAGSLAAQAHVPPAAAPAPGMAMMTAHLRTMDSLMARLDSAVARMTHTRDDVTMAGVLGELVAGQKAMHAHMREMARHMSAMGPMPHTGPMPHAGQMPHQMPGVTRPDSAARPRR